MIFRYKPFISILMSLTAVNAIADSSDQPLLSTNLETRKQAMIELARSKDVSHYQELLKSNQFPLRKAAVFALARLNSETEKKEQKEQAAQSLISALNDPSSIIRFEAAHTLARWGFNEGEDILIDTLLHTNTIKRRQAAQALFHIGSAKSIKSLIYNLRDADHTVREASITTLRKITGQNFGYNPIDPRYLPLEERERKELLNRRREAVEELQSDDDQNEEVHRQRQAISDQVSKEFKSAIDGRIIEMTQDRDRAIMRWKKWWTENKDGNRTGWLTSGLSHDNPLTRLTSISSLGDMKATGAFAEIAQALNDTNTEVVITACRALTQLKNKEAIPALIQLLEDNEGAGKTEQEKLIRNYTAYQALLSLTQANFSSLANTWRTWWDTSENFFTIGQDLPHGPFNIRLLSVSGHSATFEVKMYRPAQKEWFRNEFEVSIGEEIGQSNQEHTFEIQGRTFSKKIDMRSKLILKEILASTVILKPKDSEVTQFELSLNE